MDNDKKEHLHRKLYSLDELIQKFEGLLGKNSILPPDISECLEDALPCLRQLRSYMQLPPVAQADAVAFMSAMRNRKGCDVWPPKQSAEEGRKIINLSIHILDAALSPMATLAPDEIPRVPKAPKPKEYTKVGWYNGSDRGVFSVGLTTPLEVGEELYKRNAE